MRLTRIQFQGFKRLASASCNVDGKLIAFVGPNEAGKSSVLEGLHWLTNQASTPLAPYLRSRGKDVDDETECVRATFHLDDSDHAVIAHIACDSPPRRFILTKTAGGSLRYGVDPQVARPSEPFEAVSTALNEFEWPDDDAFDRARELVQTALVLLSTAPNSQFAAHEIADLRELSEVLRHPPNVTQTDGDEAAHPQVVSDSRAGDLADLLDEAIEAGSTQHPSEAIRHALYPRAPRFLMFSEGDRALSSAYNLADDAFRSNPPRSVTNLLSVAEVGIDELWRAVQHGDLTALRTLVRRMNERLEKRVRPTWRQSELTVSVNVDGTVLQVFIDELHADGSTVAIHERSDGLKAFIALICFLATAGLEGAVAPILLIDEAETHLHYDAQADLLDVLQEQIDAAQVLYTTHSPGCLPPDLGTGIRLVVPDGKARDTSVLRNDFWRSQEPGFSPLLFAMGAGAAAFSACRRAVLGEGPTEMILLPTLIRLATDAGTLPYQVAPGLSTLRRGEYAGDIASRLAYIVDGDEGGRALRGQLEGTGVSPTAIVDLPVGTTIEDLIEPVAYTEAVNSLLADAGHQQRVSVDELGPDGPLVKRIRTWFEGHGITPLGKPTIASYLVQAPDRIVLTPAGADVLRTLHERFCSTLEC